MRDEIDSFEVRFFTRDGVRGQFFDSGVFRTFDDAREEARGIAYIDGLRSFVVDLHSADPEHPIWKWNGETSAQRATWCAAHARRTLHLRQFVGLYAPSSDYARALSWANEWRRRTSRIEPCAVCARPTEHWPLGHDWDAPCCSDECAVKLACYFVENAERDAVLDLLARNWLPARARWDEFEALGFVLGATVPGEPLFRYAELPNGWRKEGSHVDHRILYLVDERGIARVTVFYQSAQYHRNASCTIIDVGREAADEAIDGPDDPSLPGFWERMTADERSAFVEVIEEAARRNQADRAPWAAYKAERLRTLLSLVGALNG